MSFPAAFSGARGPIAETANKWARHFASSPQTCTDYMSRTACEQVKVCEPGMSIPACRAKARQWGAEFLGATAQRIAIRGDRAAATLSNDVIVQLRRIATGEWLIDGMGPYGAVGPDAAAQRRQHGVLNGRLGRHGAARRVVPLPLAALLPRGRSSSERRRGAA